MMGINKDKSPIVERFAKAGPSNKQQRARDGNNSMVFIGSDGTIQGQARAGTDAFSCYENSFLKA